MSNENLKLNMEYRPKKFKDVVGQENVLKVLMGSLRSNRVQNAYLLEGDSGLGKTSLMRIFSNALICKNRDSECEPCGECEACKIFKTNPALVDVIEIDAGESGGVDKIRELKEVLKYAPKEGYRVIIIDEAHRLTKEGATALLKPIEEPPTNTVFMIATTEADKIMDTIKNRCMKLKFNKIPRSLMINRLREISIKHNIDIDNESLNAIALSSKGLMREAISLLEQISIMVNDRRIVKSDLDGIIDMESGYILDIIDIIFSLNIIDLMELIDKVENNITVNDFDYIISNLRKMIFNNNVDKYKVVGIIDIFIDYKNKCKINVQPKVLFEVACMKSIGYLSENNIESNICKGDSINKGFDLDYVKLNKLELFLSLMCINYIDFECFIESAIVEIDNDIVYFTVNDASVKKEIISYLKKDYSQKLKPICNISGFVVRVR